MDAVERAIAAFVDRYGLEPELVATAPGRVNLIGEHTDYNGGHVLPMALPFVTAIAASARVDHVVTVASEGFDPARFSIGDHPASTDGWARYLHGVGWELADSGIEVRGWSGVVTTDVPVGASLSSSAALEVASANTFCRGVELDPLTIAQVGQRVENHLIGMPCGIMDQLVSAAAVAGHALLIDCASLTYRPVPIPAEATVVVMDTLTRRRLVDSEFAARRHDCEEAARRLGVTHLVEAALADLSDLGGPDDRLRRRARHVVTENQRTLDAAAALQSGDLAALGELMDDSHRSLRDDYQVSGPALDAIVDLARHAPGCLGARMTGGGFAGCAVALVTADLLDVFAAHVEAGSGRTCRLYPVKPGPGAAVAIPRARSS